jgi:hypothetical protein
VLAAGHASAQTPTLAISSPTPDAIITLGDDPEQTVDVVVAVSDFSLRAAGQCGGEVRCGHLHLKIDPADESCNIPGRAYNSMNSVVGGDVVKARFAYCHPASGAHVIGVLLANDNHTPVIVDGKPVTASVTVTTK